MSNEFERNRIECKGNLMGEGKAFRAGKGGSDSESSHSNEVLRVVDMLV